MKKQGKTIFVSGVFDILHPGHIRFLKQAKNQVGESGKLIVALHDDNSIRKKKGNSRPVNSLKDRIFVLKALKCVDEVIPWHGWENIEELVRELKPDYIAVSGNEYKLKTVEKVAKDIGAELVIFSKSEKYSTTNIINRILQKK